MNSEDQNSLKESINEVYDAARGTQNVSRNVLKAIDSLVVDYKKNKFDADALAKMLVKVHPDVVKALQKIRGK